MKKRLNDMIVGLCLVAAFVAGFAIRPALAVAPPRTAAWCISVGLNCPNGQPYAEKICDTDPNVIFCEDFNYLGNLTLNESPAACQASAASCISTWYNPALITCSGSVGTCPSAAATGKSVDGPFSFGPAGRMMQLASIFPAKPQGAMPSGTQPDGVWSANWDPTQNGGVQDAGTTWAYLRADGANYQNGMAPAQDVYIRFQIYWTSNYTWPGDPKTDIYNYGTPVDNDNKILGLYPVKGAALPTNATYDSNLHTQMSIWDSVSNAQFGDSMGFRYGDASPNYKYFPGCANCNNYGAPESNVSYTAGPYMPYENLTFRNPHFTPQYRKTFRFDTNTWYTIEVRHKLSNPQNTWTGTVQIWINGTLVYDEQNNMNTCGPGDGTAQAGDCSGLGSIFLGAYHYCASCAGHTVWNGQQVIDNLVVSTHYIGPPKTSIANTLPPAKPVNLTLR